ncbi:HNH endonuclease [Roseivivax sp. THAF40]|uniref:HNH endonuclease n=1 Tax=Roseivivax sp. THAF40 TaxID=2587858 RepID=UPI001562CC91|nr:HNH endonuclease signature motif containing protein [Roseivivax sp. THAF40]
MTFGEDRQYGGNVGYEDDLERLYKYDSKVPNHKNVAKGDLIILRGKQSVFGIATIKKIKKNRGLKVLKRCPECGITSIRYRPSKQPKWRCDNGKHEFEEPISTEIEVDLFEAEFGETFSPLNDEITITDLRSITIKRNDQLAIQQLNLQSLEKLIKINPGADRALLCSAASAPVDIDRDEDDFLEFNPSMIDQREKILRAIRTRRGQSKFRKRILNRFDGRCVVSGCMVQELLEAAHIMPYRGEEFNHTSNGLLLRTDLHTLFDLGMLRINPESFEVFIDKNIQDQNYMKFHGIKLDTDRIKATSIEALRVRWEACDAS